MIEYEFKGKRIEKIVPEREMVLEYFIVRECREGKEEPFYGIEIRKTEGAQSEKEIVRGISYEKDLVEGLLDRMFRGIVTPMSLVEVVDDCMTEILCS